MRGKAVVVVELLQKLWRQRSHMQKYPDTASSSVFALINSKQLGFK